MPDYSKYPDEDELEQLMEEQEPVFSRYWYTGTPGIIGDWENIYRWGDGYIIKNETDEHNTVYPSLRAALEESERNRIFPTTEEITCTEMSAEELAPLLRAFDPDEGSFEILINGEPWETDDTGRFRKV